MYFNGEFIGKWCILKASGNSYEVSNGESVYKVSSEDIEGAKIKEKGELMMHLPSSKLPPMKLAKAPVKKKKTATKKKKA